MATMNLAEQKQLLKFVKKEWPREIDFWVGGTRIGRGPWKWVTGETIPDHPDLMWYEGEQGPGNKPTDNNHLVLHAAKGEEGLHRQNGLEEYPYICELKVDTGYGEKRHNEPHNKNLLVLASKKYLIILK